MIFVPRSATYGSRGPRCARHALRLDCKHDSTLHEAIINREEIAQDHFKANLTYFLHELRTCLHNLRFISCRPFKYYTIVLVP